MVAVVFCEGCGGVVKCEKVLKLAKSDNVEPLLGVWVIFVVFVRKGCG